MRIALLHNEDAGAGAEQSQIREAIERHGHEIVRVVDNKKQLPRLLDDNADLVAVAGGDGTVAAAARVLARQGLLMTILPLGTANNVASNLGLDGDLDQLIQRWDRGRRRPFDLGICSGSWGETTFLESVGCGLIATGISAMQAQAPDANERPAARISRAVRNYREVLSTLNANSLLTVVDGTARRAAFLLVEVLNTRSIGPNLWLSTDADPSDGVFAVVTAREEHREELRAYLDLQLDGASDFPSLPTARARRVEIDGPAIIHVDGEIQALTGPVSIRIDTAALEFLV